MEDNMFFDYTKAKNETAAKNAARLDLTQLFIEFLKERFGEENVGLVNKNEIGFYFGEVNDNEGFPVFMAATIKPVIKNYQDHVGTKRATKAYDLEQKIEDFAKYGVASED